jgi:polyphosphate kinase 2 (PPK2 family)
MCAEVIGSQSLAAARHRRGQELAKLIEPMRVAPQTKVVLERDYDPGFKAGWLRKEDGEQHLRDGVELLAEYQDRLAAQDTYGLLVVLQALDAAGKDGTIRHVMSGVNPQGVVVHSFKVPSAEELNHDFLWRYATRIPTRGQIGIFNRSHYEEVLVVRVHPEVLERQRLPPLATKRNIWRRRYREINNWERYLVDNGASSSCCSMCPGRSSVCALSSGSTPRTRTGSSPPPT